MLSLVNFANIRRHWILVLAFGLVGAVAAFAYSYTLTPMFRSTATLYFTLNFGNSASDLAQGSTYTSNQMQSFGQLTTSPAVLDPVIRQLNLDLSANDLAKFVDVATPRDTVIMDISVVDPSPQEAANIANAIAEETRLVIQDYAPQMQNGKPSVQVRVIAEAVPADYQFTPDKKLNTGAGLFIGLLLGVLATFLLAALDNRIRNADSLASVGPVSYLGSLRKRPEAAGREGVVLQEPASRAAEEYRQLRSSLRFATMSKHPLVLVVSSSLPGEGKTTVATNLAAVLAEAGQRTLLVDADLRKPLVAEYTHISGSVGLSEILVEAATLTEAVQPLGLSGVDVLVAGDVPPNPGELLASSRMGEILREAAITYQTIVIDTAPILAVADALSLAPVCDGILIVSRSGKTSKRDLTQTLDTIHGAGATVFGVVINDATPRSDRSVREYRYASPDSEPSSGTSPRAAAEQAAAPAEQTTPQRATKTATTGSEQ